MTMNRDQRFAVLISLERFFATLPDYAWDDRRLVAQEAIDLFFQVRPLRDPRLSRAAALALSTTITTEER